MLGSPESGICCILFDLGSTLWEHCDAVTWAALEGEANAAAVGVLRERSASSAALAQDDVALGLALREQVEGAVWAAWRQDQDSDNEPDFAAVAAEGLQALGISQADRALGAAVYEALRVRAARSRVLFPDALQTLAALRARGYALGVVTNRHYGGRPFLDDLAQLGLLEFFAPEHIAISADLGCRKPHPAIFWHALDGLGVAPAQAAMVGDRLEADIYGAQRLGLFTVWKPKPEEWAEAGAARFTHSEAAASAASEGAAPGTSMSSEEQRLFAYVRARDLTERPRVGEMAPPNAIISSLQVLLTIFGGAGTAL